MMKLASFGLALCVAAGCAKQNKSPRVTEDAAGPRASAEEHPPDAAVILGADASLAPTPQVPSFAPPRGKVEAKDLPALFEEARAAGWELWSIGKSGVVLRSDSQIFSVDFAWEPLVDGGEEIASSKAIGKVVTKLGLATHLDKMKASDPDRTIWVYDLAKLKSATAKVAASPHLGYQCPTGPARLSQLAKAASGGTMFHFRSYDDGDHSEPGGQFAMQRLAANKDAAVDVSHIECETPRDKLEGAKASVRMWELLREHPIKEYGPGKTAKSLTLRFSSGDAETTVAELLVGAKGEMETLETWREKGGRHMRTYNKKAKQLSVLAKKGPINTVEIVAGALTVGNEGGQVSVSPKDLCCLIHDGEDEGQEVCSDNSGYESWDACE